LVFLLHMSVKFEFGVFLSSDAMLARYMPSSCVRLCGVDVAGSLSSQYSTQTLICDLDLLILSPRRTRSSSGGTSYGAGREVSMQWARLDLYPHFPTVRAPPQFSIYRSTVPHTCTKTQFRRSVMVRGRGNNGTDGWTDATD